MTDENTQTTADHATGRTDTGKTIGSAPVDPAAAQAVPHVLEQLQASAGGVARDLERIMDIPVQLSVEIGRTRTSIKNVLQLAQGSVVELDAMAGAPMDVLVNGYLIAQGEVVVVNDRFGIRLTDIVTPAERVRRLNRG